MLRERVGEEEARRRLRLSTQRMSAVLDKLETLEPEPGDARRAGPLPPVQSPGMSRRRGPLDVRPATNVVPVRQAVLLPAPPSSDSELTVGSGWLTPRGTARFRRVARVQQQAEERFLQSQRDLLPATPPPAQHSFVIPPPPPPATLAIDESEDLLREFEQAWMEAGRAPRPDSAQSLTSTPPTTWRWRTSPANGIRTPQRAGTRELQRAQTARLPRPQPQSQEEGGVDWDRAVAELRREEEHALEAQSRSTQPLHTTLHRSWKSFSTPSWILENLDEPELYTYTLQKRRVRPKAPTPDPTPTPPRTPTPPPEPEPEPEPPPPESADDKLARIAAAMDLEFKSFRHFAWLLWALLHKARILLAAESIEQDAHGNYTITYPTANAATSVHAKMPKSIQHGSTNTRYSYSPSIKVVLKSCAVSRPPSSAAQH